MSGETKPSLIPALWFDAKGCGPSNLALQLHPFPAEMGGRIPAMLGLRVRLDLYGEGISLVLHGADQLVDGGFNMHRDCVVELHRQLGEWLAANPFSGAATSDPEKRGEKSRDRDETFWERGEDQRGLS